MPYREILNGSTLVRLAPGARHELICGRLHQRVQASLATLTSTLLLSARAEVRPRPDIVLRPDLALVAADVGKLWLAAEIVSSDDHAPDTVAKKQIYEEVKLPRLWMIDPRYDNVEVYHASPYGLVLKEILTGNEVLVEKLLPGFELRVAELFAVAGRE